MRLAIIGAGNLGSAIADGLVKAGSFDASEISLTRRSIQLLEPLKDRGFVIEEDNRSAASSSDIVLVAVEPQQINDVLDELSSALEPGRHTVISVATGVPSKQILARVPDGVSVVRAMPNTAIAIHESMTCIAADNSGDDSIAITKKIFDAVGKTMVIEEELMTAATALGGIAERSWTLRCENR